MPSHKSRKYCCICSNYRGKMIDKKQISLHRFPAHNVHRRIWTQRAKLVRKDFVYTSNSYLCSEHFLDGAGPSKLHTLPSIFPNKVFKTTSVHGATGDNGIDVATCMNEIDKTQDFHEETKTCTIGIASAGDRLLDSLNFHDYHGKTVTTKIFTCNKETQTFQNHDEHRKSTTTCTISTQTENFTLKKDIPVQTDLHFMCSNRELGVQVNRPVFTYEDVENDDAKILFYTGIQNKETFEALFDEMKDDATENTSRGSNATTSNTHGRPRILRLIDEIFMVFMRLRLGILLEDLADRFGISVSSCCLIFNRWIDYLDVKLHPLIMWPSRETVRATLPDSFRKKYSNCRVIIDCTEIFVESPSSLQNKSLLYSDYKSHMTFKALVGISPAGVTTFASDLWSGSISDKQLTIQSGLLDLLDVGDAIMADKGFVISDLTTPRGIHLILPPFKHKNKQFSREEVILTREIVSLRIHVERQMERIKNFHTFEGVMRIRMASQASKIWKICVALTNLLPPLCQIPEYDMIDKEGNLP